MHTGGAILLLKLFTEEFFTEMLQTPSKRAEPEKRLTETFHLKSAKSIRISLLLEIFGIQNHDLDFA